jgi:multidrug efflux pump subunit AcrA (membrane-fusion protein)
VGVVFVVHGDTVERRAVRLGAAGGDHVTVLSGLAAGDQIAVGDFNQLKEGSKIRIEKQGPEHD